MTWPQVSAGCFGEAICFVSLFCLALRVCATLQSIKARMNLHDTSATVRSSSLLQRSCVRVPWPLQVCQRAIGSIDRCTARSSGQLKGSHRIPLFCHGLICLEPEQSKDPQALWSLVCQAGHIITSAHRGLRSSS